MSDLQCPARFLVVGDADASLAEALRHERVAAVYDGRGRASHPDGPDGAVTLGERLGLPVEVMQHSLGVRDVLAQEPVALESLSDLADLHRGETVLVVADGAPGSRVDVSIDGDGSAVVEVSPGDER